MMRRLSSAAGAGVWVVLIALVVAVVVVPAVIGARLHPVTSSSMEPALSRGDLMIARTLETAQERSELTVGQVVTYATDPRGENLVTHRIAEITTGTTPSLVTRGDANDADDEAIGAGQVVATYAYHLPLLGYAALVARSHPTLAAVGAVALIGGGVAAMALPRLRGAHGRRASRAEVSGA